MAFVPIIAIIGMLWMSIGGELAHAWQGDKAMSHGPLVPIIALALLWMRRDRLQQWDSNAKSGLFGLAITVFLFICAVWADVEFMKPLALIGVMLSIALYLGGWKTATAAAGPLGFLLFMIPWPTTLTERLAFPLQLTSSSYAALLASLIGIPVQREGVNLHVMPDPFGQPIFSITVALQCSGLTSFMVLMALSYLIAYFTPIKLAWRAALMATILPLTLLANSVRLAIILLIGAEFNRHLAMMVHDNEGPFLIFFCSILLMTIRNAMLKWSERPKNDDAPKADGRPNNEMISGTKGEDLHALPLGNH